MTGIPVYTQSPISTAKADGITPKTAAPPSGTTTSAPAANPATTTAAASTTSSYPAAKPGAYPAPAPTNFSGQPTGPAHNYIPSPPTPTKTTGDDGPPAPQPGAVPVAPSSIRSNLPPPPKAGEKYLPPAPQTASPQPYLPQMGYSSPSTIYQPPTSSTVTASTPSRSYPVAVPTQSLYVVDNVAPRTSFEHPPGTLPFLFLSCLPPAFLLHCIAVY